jgi:5'-nucleotidase (lipoprotein e(P4) family)
MTETTGRNPWPFAAAGLALGLLIGVFAGHEASPRVNPQLRALDANLWQHTSAEYRACCLQAYALATRQLAKKLTDAPAGRPAAVVMDLDETVLDNAAFQTALYRRGKPYSEDAWRAWVAGYPEEVRLVPGAKAFIDDTEAKGVQVFYISNRDGNLREPTLAALRNLKLDLKDIGARLLLATTTSDKTARQNAVKATHHVLLWVGDNLRDFEDRFLADKVDPSNLDEVQQALARRAALVDGSRARFGDDFIILPNPMYGEWTRLQGARPVEVLRPTKMTGR